MLIIHSWVGSMVVPCRCVELIDIPIVLREILVGTTNQRHGTEQVEASWVMAKKSWRQQAVKDSAHEARSHRFAFDECICSLFLFLFLFCFSSKSLFCILFACRSAPAQFKETGFMETTRHSTIVALMPSRGALTGARVMHSMAPWLPMSR